jgi:hypothetical protein
MRASEFSGGGKALCKLADPLTLQQLSLRNAIAQLASALHY